MEFTDQMQRTIQLHAWPPRRIVSLVPSQTELLADLDLSDAVVGITKFCLYPHEWYQQKTRIGGTKTLNIPKIIALQPDLILGNKEENDQEQIHALARHFPMWMSDIMHLPDALDMIRQVGTITGRDEKANALATSIAQKFAELPFQQAGAQKKVAYFIWRKPFMAAGSQTFIDDMLQRAGFQNVFAHLTRYPEITPEQLATAQPDCVFLSSEPYPFAPKHLAEIQSICPDAQIKLVDGELFSWYGSRLLLSPPYFCALWQSFAQKS